VVKATEFGNKLTQDELVERAGILVFGGKKMMEQKGRQVAQAAKDRAGKAITPPRDTGSDQFTSNASSDPEAIALKNIRKKFDELGVGT
jgi:hypothetical protein